MGPEARKGPSNRPEKRSKEEIVIGGIYMHLGNPAERYQVLQIVEMEDATGFEKTGKTKTRVWVQYKQLYTGQRAEGTIWHRSPKNFLGYTELGNERKVKNFTLVGMGESM